MKERLAEEVVRTGRSPIPLKNRLMWLVILNGTLASSFRPLENQKIVQGFFPTNIELFGASFFPNISGPPFRRGR